MTGTSNKPLIWPGTVPWGVRIGVALVLGACGRIGFAPAPDAPVCTFGAFAAPVRLAAAVQSPQDDWGPTPTRGGLELFFYSFRTGSIAGDLYYATRPSLDADFGAALRVDELATDADDGSPTLTDDALVLVFQRAGDLFEATRPAPDTAFGVTAALAIDSTTADGDPFTSADGLRLVFASSRIGPDQHGLDLFEATRPARGAAFGQPVELAALDTDVDDFSPTLSADGLEIFFASRRAGGPGGADVYTARRPALDEPFAAPVLVPELSSARDDVGLRLAADGTTLFFDYDALTMGGANADLWTAVRSCQ
jgi:WD40 repeat protein